MDRTSIAADYVEVMSDEPLTNAALEWMRTAFDFVNKLDAKPEGRAPITGDFRYEDRRVGGFNFGRLGASDMDAYSASAWNVADGGLHQSIAEVIAVRGQRSAAFVEVVDYGEDTLVEVITCCRLDADLRRLERLVILGVEDRVAAIAELDRMHEEIDD
jgi:hypothetical protein